MVMPTLVAFILTLNPKIMRSFFYFKQAERQGILFFLCLISAAFIWPKVYGHYWQKDQFIQLELQILDTLTIAPVMAISSPVNDITSNPEDTVFLFNPNQVSLHELIQLGLAKRVASTLINFRNKGGRFYQKTDLLKIYGLEESWYNKVVDYVQLPNKPERYGTTKTNSTSRFPAVYPTKKSIPIVINVNQADATEWARLSGIGPVLSKRIVKFREKLGGFYSLDQVGQTYGLADSVFQLIKDQLILELDLQAFKINELSTKELASHPYLSWKDAQIINSYRLMHGPFENRAALEKVQVLDQEKINLLTPYLDFCAPCPVE